MSSKDGGDEPGAGKGGDDDDCAETWAAMLEATVIAAKMGAYFMIAPEHTDRGRLSGRLRRRIKIEPQQGARYFLLTQIS